MGVCIWAAGAATSQSTPSCTYGHYESAVTGSQTITYACVGYDSLGGLTAASSSGTVHERTRYLWLIARCYFIEHQFQSNVLTVNFCKRIEQHRICWHDYSHYWFNRFKFNLEWCLYDSICAQQLAKLQLR